MNKLRTDITIPVQPWFKDHCFGGKVVLPAVETMQLLAEKVAENHPGCPIHCMEDATFAKFLVVPEGAASVEAMIELVEPTSDRLYAKLLSRVRIRKMTRVIEHGSVGFCLQQREKPSLKPLDFLYEEKGWREVSAEYIYSELVPFGSAYQTLQGNLYLSDGCARGTLEAPDFPLSDQSKNSLGSPFPLDGALHGACVLGQQSVDFIPFPVGFEKRIVHKPTCPGGRYTTCIHQKGCQQDELIFDIGIFDREKELCESVYGVRMRDVSGSITRN